MLHFPVAFNLKLNLLHSFNIFCFYMMFFHFIARMILKKSCTKFQDFITLLWNRLSKDNITCTQKNLRFMKTHAFHHHKCLVALCTGTGDCKYEFLNELMLSLLCWRIRCVWVILICHVWYINHTQGGKTYMAWNM